MLAHKNMKPTSNQKAHLRTFIMAQMSAWGKEHMLPDTFIIKVLINIKVVKLITMTNQMQY